MLTSARLAKSTAIGFRSTGSTTNTRSGRPCRARQARAAANLAASSLTNAHAVSAAPNAHDSRETTRRSMVTRGLCGAAANGRKELTTAVLRISPMTSSTSYSAPVSLDTTPIAPSRRVTMRPAPASTGPGGSTEHGSPDHDQYVYSGDSRAMGGQTLEDTNGEF